MTPIRYTRFCKSLNFRLTPGQNAFARVTYDGDEPSALAGTERDLARRIFGASVETVPLSARSVVVQVKGRDVGGTRMGATRLLHLGCTLNLDRFGQNELFYAFVGAPKLRLARTPLRFCLADAEKLQAQGDIEIEDQTADGFTIVRHDGRRVRFEAFAASRGGDNIRGVPIVAALLDEASFYFDDVSGVASDRGIFNAIIPRLLPGGQVIIASSPWGPTGLLAEEFDANYNRPTTAIAAHCPTLLMRDDPETIATVERERERSEKNARREFDAEFLAGAYSIASAEDLDAVTEAELPAGMIRNGQAFGSLDTAQGKEGQDGIVLSVAFHARAEQSRRARMVMHPGTQIPMYAERDEWGRVVHDELRTGTVLRIAEVRGWENETVRGLTIVDVVNAIAARCHAWGVTQLFGDQFESSGIGGLLSHHGIKYRTYHLSESSKMEVIGGVLRRHIREKTISLIPCAELRSELLAIREVPRSGGRFGYDTGGKDFAGSLINLLHGLSDPEVIGLNTNPSVRIWDAPNQVHRGGRTIVGGR